MRERVAVAVCHYDDRHFRIRRRRRAVAVLFGLVLTAVGIAVMRPVARLLGANDEMIETCVLYGRIVVGFTTFYMLQNIFQSFLAAAEKPKLGLAVTAIAATVFFIVKRKKYGYA